MLKEPKRIIAEEPRRTVIFIYPRFTILFTVFFIIVISDLLSTSLDWINADGIMLHNVEIVSAAE